MTCKIWALKEDCYGLCSPQTLIQASYIALGSRASTSLICKRKVTHDNVKQISFNKCQSSTITSLLKHNCHRTFTGCRQSHQLQQICVAQCSKKAASAITCGCIESVFDCAGTKITAACDFGAVLQQPTSDHAPQINAKLMIEIMPVKLVVRFCPIELEDTLP